VVFHPFLDEILIGKIKGCSPEGVHGKAAWTPQARPEHGGRGFVLSPWLGKAQVSEKLPSLEAELRVLGPLLLSCMDLRVGAEAGGGD
jgi:hypothetical protein